MLQSLVHYFLHLIAIGAIAWWYDKEQWKRNWLILLATMAVDLDHLFASPLFDPMRCGIGYHPLHHEFAILVYLLGVVFVKHRLLKLIFIGLLFHMVTDFIDCLFIFAKCALCFENSELYKWTGLF